MAQYVFERESSNYDASAALWIPSQCYIENEGKQPLTEVREGALYFCLEQHLVSVCGQKIDLTAKEFDILALLIMNPRRVFTYEMIMELVWKEDYNFYSRKAITNHASNLRKKLRVSPELPDYIKSVHSIGYKFNTD